MVVNILLNLCAVSVLSTHGLWLNMMVLPGWLCVDLLLSVLIVRQREFELRLCENEFK